MIRQRVQKEDENLENDAWKLLKSVFIVCSSMAICFIGYVLVGENTKMLTAGITVIGLIGIITGIIMGCVALKEHAK